MAFYSKYFYTFKDSQKNSFRVDFLKDVGVEPTSFELQAGVEPFSVNYPDQGKLTYKRGSGAAMNLISRTNFELISLYTIDVQEIMIRVTRNDELIWVGWLDSELYTEPYNITYNYPVQFSANDGIAILKRLSFVDDAELNFEGIMSEWDIVKIIVDKIGLPFTELSVAMSTEFTTGYDNNPLSNVLMQTYVNAQNFYDEDNEASDLDTVLKGILEPYGATLVQSEGKLLIIDINSLAASTITFKRYDATNYSYISTETTNNVLEIRDIGWKAPNQVLDVVSGINEQVIGFSPYNKFATIISEDSDDDKLNNSGEWYESDGYYIKTVSNYDWSIFSNGIYRGSKQEIDAEPEYHILWSNDNNPLDYQDRTNSQTVAEFKGSVPYIIGNNTKSLKVNFETLVRTKSNPYDSDIESYHIPNYHIEVKIRIGDKYYNGIDGKWYANSDLYKAVSMGDWGKSEGTAPNKADEWQEVRAGGTIIALEEGLTGELGFEIISHFSTLDDTDFIPNYDYTEIHDLWFRNLEINIVDNETETEIEDSDIEYVGYLNKSFKGSGDSIDLICGTNTKDSPVSLGGLLRYGNGSGTDIVTVLNYNYSHESTTDIPSAGEIIHLTVLNKIRINDIDADAVGVSTLLSALTIGDKIQIDNVIWTIQGKTLVDLVNWEYTVTPLVTANEGFYGVKFTQIGDIVADGFFYIKEWQRGSAVGKIEQLLLNTVESNYEFSTLSLRGSLNNKFEIFNTLKDSDYILDKVFMITGININYEDNLTAFQSVEIIEDNLTINEI